MNGGQQQAYDRGTNIFSPDGRLYQVEYAREAVRRGSVSVGVRTRDGVVLAAKKAVRSPLMEATAIEKLHKIDDHIGVASAGHVADARRLVDFGRRRAQTDRLRYGEPMGIDPFTKAMVDHVQEFTQQGGARPFGAALLIGGVDPAIGEDEPPRPRLFETDPSGTFYEWQATAIGAEDDTVREYLESELRPAEFGPVRRRTRAVGARGIGGGRQPLARGSGRGDDCADVRHARCRGASGHARVAGLAGRTERRNVGGSITPDTRYACTL